mmetsp:Transcript_8782/g.20652  ORF Transcript_8782/g.20652 Transcript_8782/m.20652 type:complete len:190 (+) Transcript_8782:76-645(+)|eukprot:CAMPEP_0171113496 /NCGR_PEP_ID=MMETSP0766_2-20121228/82629_1 /TAXON_ID=439317 /ORGANISM="Gambierdiscus australes, Strain CAWD 149" /LENGTH=189 /DNA_ID=CAMNT_0011575705 /DNA_START=37 /DNA_END=606 /DNA_ORIENTATION=-
MAEHSLPKELPEQALASLQGGWTAMQEKAQQGLVAAKARANTARAGKALLDGGGVAAEQAIRAKVATQRVVALDDEVSQHLARALAELDEAVQCLRRGGPAADALFTGNTREINARIKAYEARAQTYRQLMGDLGQLPAPLAMSASEQDAASILRVRDGCHVAVRKAAEGCGALRQKVRESSRAKRLCL